ncbi:MAG: ABC transporter permease [Patescibacteria group bacterium]
MNLHSNYLAFLTIFRKEVVRILRIWTQTLLPSVITTSLYFLIFGSFIGSQVSDINGVSFITFIVPGLVMMAIITNAFSNVVSSFFGSKFQRNIEEIMVSPTPNWVIIAGFASGGVFRGGLVGIIVYLISLLFTNTQINNLGIVIVYSVLTAVVFSLGGLFNGIYSKKFDDVAIVPTFVITPLTYLGGVFYSIDRLPEFWRQVSRLNPVLYMVDGFRYGFLGFSDINILHSLTVLCSLTLFLVWLNLYLLNKGIGLRS